MTIQLEEDDYLSIKLLSYDRLTDETERFCFSEMCTLRATTLFPKGTKIVLIKKVVYNYEHEFLNEVSNMTFATITDFNNFFLENPEYYIQDCDIELENEIFISSHDDGEVSIQYQRNNTDLNIINNIFEKYKLDKKLIEILRTKSGHYIAIDAQNNITGDFVNFDDYLENGRN